MKKSFDAPSSGPSTHAHSAPSAKHALSAALFLAVTSAVSGVYADTPTDSPSQCELSDRACLDKDKQKPLSPEQIRRQQLINRASSAVARANEWLAAYGNQQSVVGDELKGATARTRTALQYARATEAGVRNEPSGERRMVIEQAAEARSAELQEAFDALKVALANAEHCAPTPTAKPKTAKVKEVDLSGSTGHVPAVLPAVTPGTPGAGEIAQPEGPKAELSADALAHRKSEILVSLREIEDRIVGLAGYQVQHHLSVTKAETLFGKEPDAPVNSWGGVVMPSRTALELYKMAAQLEVDADKAKDATELSQVEAGRVMLTIRLVSDESIKSIGVKNAAVAGTLLEQPRNTYSDAVMTRLVLINKNVPATYEGTQFKQLTDDQEWLKHLALTAENSKNAARILAADTSVYAQDVVERLARIKRGRVTEKNDPAEEHQAVEDRNFLSHIRQRPLEFMKR